MPQVSESVTVAAAARCLLRGRSCGVLGSGSSQSHGTPRKFKFKPELYNSSVTYPATMTLDVVFRI
eukprot:3282863-Rhodomonas_salina.1